MRACRRGHQWEARHCERAGEAAALTILFKHALGRVGGLVMSLFGQTKSLSIDSSTADAFVMAEHLRG